MPGASVIGGSAIAALPEEFSAQFTLQPPEEANSIIQVASFIDRALIARLQQFPEDLRVIDRRMFEQLVAELFAGFGYEVELTQRTRDGGKDIIAIKRREIDLKFLIECKRPDPGNHVGVSTVRELYGVKVDDGASKAILATTTYFSLDAKLFTEKHRWELELRDFDAIRSWIDDYMKERPAYPCHRTALNAGNNMTALDKLLHQVRACTVCAPHLPHGPRPVLRAAATARLLVVGQAPGRKVHDTCSRVIGDRPRFICS